MANKVTTAIPEYKDCKSADILTWCKENGKVDWLKQTKADIKAKAEAAGKHPGYFALRKAFFTEFAPEKIPTKGKKTIWDEIDAL